VLPQSKVLDLGCAGGEISAALRKQKNCHVVGVDSHRPNASDCLDDYLQHDLNKGLPKLPLDLDYIMLLDVIEHLVAPEKFVSELRHAIRLFPKIKIIVSTPNIAFIVTRVMLMFGQFNYGKRGILDMTHMRLFTFSSLRALLEQRGFQVTEVVGVPAPFPLALGNGKVAGLLIGINKILIHLSKRLFSYQVLMVAQPRTSLEFLLKAAEEESKVRVSARG
jgi:2-polyprenyl-3-methyl-5-hydroxy-6-metoxy-1,4-benzoquinol methylase